MTGEEKLKSRSPDQDSPVREVTAVRPVDQFVLELLRREAGLNISDLVDRLEVTPTAVRTRLDRLEAMGLIERSKVSLGRGRPSFKYFLTSAGWRQVGATYADLATAVWDEIESIDDDQTRQEWVSRIARRMGRAYSNLLPQGTLENKLGAIARVLTARKIPCGVEDSSGNLPVLTVHACPFPDLIGEDKRSACELEQQALSEAVGQELELSCCRLDGHSTCQFRPATVVS